MTETTQGWFSDETATFGDRLCAAREAGGMTQEDLARRLGVRLTTVQSWENDRGEPRANRLQMLAGMLGVSIRWLLTGEGDGLDGPPEGPALHHDAQELLADLARTRAAVMALAGDLGRTEKRLRLMLREAAP